LWQCAGLDRLFIWRDDQYFALKPPRPKGDICSL
jgi:hypothetical protein